MTETSTVVAFDAKAYPTPPGPDGIAGQMVLLSILVERVDGVKAYAAIVPDTSRQDPYYREVSKWVHRFGNPLRFEAARAIWPGLEPKEYAR